MEYTQNEAPTIACSTVELSFLASLLGANMLLGIEDPFLGWLAYEIEEAWSKARQALAERQFLRMEPDNGIVMDTGVAALVGTCAFPEASFILTFTPANRESATCYFHITQNLAVEQTLTADECRLTALEDACGVYARILALLRLGEQSAALGDSTTILEEDLNKARESASQSGHGAASELLIQTGVDIETAASLATTFAHPVANGALVALAQREISWEVAGLGMLEGSNGLWLLRSITHGGENWVEASPTDAIQTHEKIRRLMNRVLPEPLETP